MTVAGANDGSLRLGALDAHLLAEGSHWRLWQVLGAQAQDWQGQQGVRFAVWAPNARAVSVVGDFNDWDGRRHPLSLDRDCGVWLGFVAGAQPGQAYKFEVLDADGRLWHKADPLARWCEPPPRSASRIAPAPGHCWRDADWMAARAARPHRETPIAIYEVHLGSWRRAADGGLRSYAEIAPLLVEHVRSLGYTHVELLPIAEHPFGGSWGYQPLALYAPTSRHGTPDDFRGFVDALHQAGIGVLLDWVPAHFPADPHGLARFDGSALYEHEDARLGWHPDWHTLIYNHGRREVANFLIANALYWLHEFHIDGLRVDAVASMLYRDYSRKQGEWLPNAHGGRENLEAVAFLERLNCVVHADAPPGVTMFAEESTSWPQVSHPVWSGGLGFCFKWNMGWMNDTLAYFREDPLYRHHHHDKLTFGRLYAHSENFVLPLSHDEVVHGKGSLLGKMPGDRWQRFANLRLLFAWQYLMPGKKLLFMGGEFGQQREWDHDGELDWAALDDAAHRGVLALVARLNQLYRELPALHRNDCDPQHFQWIDCDDRDQSVLVWWRDTAAGRGALAVLHFTPLPRPGYRIGVPRPGRWRCLLGSDDPWFGGSGFPCQGSPLAEPIAMHGQPQSIVLDLPPLAALLFVPDDDGPA